MLDEIANGLIQSKVVLLCAMHITVKITTCILCLPHNPIYAYEEASVVQANVCISSYGFYFFFLEAYAN